jgi:hypothetical protein
MRYHPRERSSEAQMSIDREIHDEVLALIRRLLDQHPRTPAEEEYLNMLQSIADEYERDFPPYLPDPGERE